MNQLLIDQNFLIEIQAEEINKLRARNAKLVKALKFYGNPDNNVHVSDMYSSISDTNTIVSDDKGETARQVLKECEELENQTKEKL